MVTTHSILSLKEQITLVVQQIHASNKENGTPGLVYAVTTGAAAGFAGMLQSQPGASSTLYAAQVPYHKNALTTFLGRTPENYCSQKTAIAMATTAYKTARYHLLRNHIEEETVSTPPKVIGLGLTAAVATDRTRKGVDKVFIARTTDPEIVWTVSAIFERGKFTREQQDKICQILALNMIAPWSYQVALDEKQLPGKLFCAEKSYLSDTQKGSKKLFALLPTRWQRSFEDTLDLRSLAANSLLFSENGVQVSLTALNPSRNILIPTSANPYHEGHAAMANILKTPSRHPVFMLETHHPVKGDMDQEELTRRIRQFFGREPVVVTNGLGLYIDKARAFPGYTFAIGSDVLLQILDPKYGPTKEEVLDVCQKHNNRFIVFSRNGASLDHNDYGIPSSYHDLFEFLSCDLNISSSEIRATIAG